MTRGPIRDDALVRRADRRLVGTAALFGVSVANHGLTLLLVPAVALFVLAVDRACSGGRSSSSRPSGTAIGVAALLYLELPLRAGPFRAALVYGHPETLQGLLDVILGRQFPGDLVGGDLVSRLVALSDLAADQLGPLALLAVPAFVITAIRHPRYALYSGVAALVTCVFAGTYENARIDRYYLGPRVLRLVVAGRRGGRDRRPGHGPGGRGRWADAGDATRASASTDPHRGRDRPGHRAPRPDHDRAPRPVERAGPVAVDRGPEWLDRRSRRWTRMRSWCPGGATPRRCGTGR